MAKTIDRHTAQEGTHLLVLRALTWVGGLLVFVVPLSNLYGTLATVAGASLGVVLANRLVVSRWRWPWVVVGSLLVDALGLAAPTLVGGWSLPVSVLGLAGALNTIQILYFGLIALGGVCALRTLTLNFSLCGILEALAIVGMVAFSFRSHRSYPFSQPQILSDWAFVEGYDPRYVLMAIGMATLVGVGMLLLPKQGPLRTAISVAVLMLLAFLLFPVLKSGPFSPVAGVNTAQASPPEDPPPNASPDKPDDQRIPGQPVPPPVAGQSLLKPSPARRTPPPPPVPAQEAPPELTIDDVRTEEGNTGTRALAFAVHLTAPTDRPVTVNYQSRGGSARDDVDYKTLRGKLTIPAGQTEAVLTVDVICDLDEEADETLFVVLSAAGNATLKREQAEGVIVNDDHPPPPPELTIDDIEVMEGDAGVTAATFTLRLSAPSNKPVVAELESIAETATGNEDYNGVRGKTTFPPGQTEYRVVVDVHGDTTVEPDETFQVRIKSATNAIIVRQQGTGTIKNDDVPPPTISIRDAVTREGHEGVTPLEFAIELSDPPQKPVGVRVVTVGGSARPDDDFQSMQATVTIPAGQKMATFIVPIQGDRIVESDEEFVVLLVAPVNAVLEREKAIGTILNDDVEPPPPTLSISDAQTKEGNQGLTPLNFTLTLSHATSKPVMVTLVVAGGTAERDIDYRASVGTATIPAGETKLTFAIPLIGDTIPERDETFAVQLVSPVGAVLARDRGIGTIENDDEPPRVLSMSVDDVARQEGNDGITRFVFTVTLSAPATTDVRFDAHTASGTAKAGDDFENARDTFTIPSGESTTSFAVNVVGDTKVEADETFRVELTNPKNAILDRAHGTGTIQNDDLGPMLSINDARVIEGNAGSTPLVFEVTLSEVSAEPVNVKLLMVNQKAIANEDCRGLQGSLMIPAGQIKATVVVQVVGDMQVEEDEDFIVRLAEPQGAGLERDQGFGTIVNDDKQQDPPEKPEDDPKINIADAEEDEGNAGTTALAFKVTLSTATNEEVKVDYDTRARTATVDKDFRPASGTLSIPPGATTATITVEVVGDLIIEDDEEIEVVLSKPVHAQIEQGTGIGAILDDDEPLLEIEDTEVTEGNDGVTTARFKVTLSEKGDEEVRVNYETIARTAEADGDFKPAKGELVIPIGQTEATVAVEVVGDKAAELNETFDVKLSKPRGAQISRGTGTGTINNDDEPAISIADAEQEEGNSATKPLEFRVTLSGPSDKEVSVRYQSKAGTATADEDFRPAGEMLRIAAGELEAVVSVPIVGDTKVERDETFDMELSEPQNATLERPLAKGTIKNDDKPVLKVEDITVNEGNAGPASAKVVATLSEAAFAEVTVRYETVAGKAEANTDFRPLTSTLSIAAGKTEGTITIEALGDLAVELDETLTLKLSDPVNCTLERESALLTIVDDDLPTVSVADASGKEGNSGATPLAFQVTLSAPTNKEVKVHYKAKAGTAAEGEDFNAADAVVSIPKGQKQASLTIEVIGDEKIERPEIFEVELSQPEHATIDRAKATGTIENDDFPKLSVADVSVDEGTDKPGEGKIVITLSEPMYEDVTVSYQTYDDSAKELEDYLLEKGEVKIPAGQTEVTLLIFAVHDKLPELDETFFYKLSNPVNATIERGTAVCTIVDDDQPNLTIDDVTVEEGQVGLTPLTFHLKLELPTNKPVVVTYDAQSRTATVGRDFGSRSGTLTIPSGQTEASIAVDVSGDEEIEPDETFVLNISKLENAKMPKSKGLGTIVNDDFPPPPSEFVIDDVAVDEGQAGTTPAVFTVRMTEPAKKEVQVSFDVVSGTAKGGEDFEEGKGVLKFPPGETTGAITVQVTGDTAVEDDEDFRVKLSGAADMIFKVSEGRGLIRNDDKETPLPQLSIESVKQAEGNEGTTKFAFTIKLSEPSEQPVEVSYATGGGNAQPDEDYRPASGKLTIPAGETTARLEIEVIGDEEAEEDEAFLVALSAPLRASLAAAEGTGTIQNDDGEHEADDELNWNSQGPQPLTPVFLARFRDEYSPVEGAYYFRTFAYSQLGGGRLVRNELIDKEILWDVPRARTNLGSRPPSATSQAVGVNIYLIGETVEGVPGLVQPVAVAPVPNPVPKEFSGVFHVTSQVLADGRRDGATVDAYRDIASGKSGDPAWDEATRQGYLAIPNDRRYRDLVREILGTLDSRQRSNPFARAMAIRKWMENNLMYDYNPKHDSADDPTASFLFGDRRGYCVHLASAMTMLLRAADVPARLAMGYRVDPERRGQRNAVLAYASDAHAWAEMYVEGIGWVVIEAGTKGRVPPQDPEPDPRELDYYLGLLGDVPSQVFARDTTAWGTAGGVAAVAAPTSLSWLLLGLFGIKYWRLLLPRFADRKKLHRVGYRSVLDQFSAVGIRRRYGETWDDFALRLRDISPEFADLTEQHLLHSFGRSEPVDEQQWRALSASVAQQIAAKIPRYRRWLGALNPISWIGVG